ncbi:MAG: glycosyltransferase [Flavobacteriia bacterium]|nr:glycosyltransferase [Flavobacteriia bacterium]
MPKVLRIINRFNIGGPTYNATFLTGFLSDEYQTLLIGGLPEKGESDSLYIPEMYGVKPILIKELQRTPNIFSDIKAYRKIKKIIKEFKPDIVHTHAAKAGALGRRAAFSCKVPIIVHTFHGHVFHSYFGQLKTFIYKWIERKLAKKSTGIIAISETQKKELSLIHQICEEKKIKVINLGFDLDRFMNFSIETRQNLRQKYRIKEDEIALAIIGRFAPIKNHHFFFDVLENILTKTKRKIKVFVVGDGETREVIENRASKINNRFGDVVFLTSWIKDVYNFNQAMEIICLTSDNEGTPVSLIEAQASSLPVITTNVGGVNDIMLDGISGFIIDKGDLKEYSEKLQYLIENDEIRKVMGEKGKDFVKETFHYKRLCKEVELYYKELLTND